MKAVVDTTVLFSGVTSLPDLELAVASLSWAELRYGLIASPTALIRAHRETRLARLRALFGPGLPFDDAAAEVYEAVCGLIVGQGHQVRGRVTDLMIAAIAASHGAAIVTKTPDSFRGLNELVPVVGV